MDDLIEIVFLQDIDDAKGLCLDKSLASSLNQNSDFTKVSSSTQAREDSLLVFGEFKDGTLCNEVHLLPNISLVDDVVAGQEDDA